jgi:hypothetical protein
MSNPETDPSIEQEATAVIMALKKSPGVHRAALKAERIFQTRSGWLGEHDGCGHIGSSVRHSARVMIRVSPRRSNSITVSNLLQPCRLAAYAAAIRIGPATSR